MNDVGRRFDPTYLVVLNPRRCFPDERWSAIEQSRARAIFSQLELGLDHPCVLRFRLGRRGGTDVHEPGRLPYTGNSPYVAACLARRMGARRIGLIGVDFTDGHFFGETGAHPLQPRLARIDGEHVALRAAFAREGCELMNLSPPSHLDSLPRMSVADFSDLAGDVAGPPAPSRRPR